MKKNELLEIEEQMPQWLVDGDTSGVHCPGHEKRDIEYLPLEDGVLDVQNFHLANLHVAVTYFTICHLSQLSNYDLPFQQLLNCQIMSSVSCIVTASVYCSTFVCASLPFCVMLWIWTNLKTVNVHLRRIKAWISRRNLLSKNYRCCHRLCHSWKSKLTWCLQAHFSGSI